MKKILVFAVVVMGLVLGRAEETLAVAPVGPQVTVAACGDEVLDAWATGTLKPTIETWYPKLVALFASPEFKAPETISLAFRTDMGGTPAWTAGAVISLNRDWIKRQLTGEALGAAIHELVHVVQQHRGKHPGWLTEGLADYARWYLFEPEKKGCRIRDWTREGIRYDASYRVTANFLDWVVRTHGVRVVKALDAACRAGRYDESLWKELTGRTAAELGEQWKTLRGRSTAAEK